MIDLAAERTREHGFRDFDDVIGEAVAALRSLQARLSPEAKASAALARAILAGEDGDADGLALDIIDAVKAGRVPHVEWKQ